MSGGEKLSAAVALACLLAASSAPAREMAWAGTLGIEFLGAGLPDVAVTGAGIATLNGSSGGVHLVSLGFAGGLTGRVAVPLTDPEVNATTHSVRATPTLGSGTLRPFGFTAPPSQPQLTRNVLPVRGQLRICMFFTGCTTSQIVPFTNAGGQTGFGVGGVWTAGGVGSRRFSMQAAPWTLRTASVVVTTESGQTVALPVAGWMHGAYSLTTSAAVTGGAVSLVTPMQITSDQGQVLSFVARWTVRFVPEPEQLLLLGSGALALLVLGRGRIRP